MRAHVSRHEKTKNTSDKSKGIHKFWDIEYPAEQNILNSTQESIVSRSA